MAFNSQIFKAPSLTSKPKLGKTTVSSSVFSGGSSNVSVKKISFGGLAKAIGSQPDIAKIDKISAPEANPLADIVSDLQSKFEGLQSTFAEHRNNFAEHRKNFVEYKNITNKGLAETNKILQDIGSALALDFANRIAEEKSEIKGIKEAESKKAIAAEEKGLEGGSKKISGIFSKTFQKVTAPVKSLFDRMMEFFTTIFTGMAVSFISGWLSNDENRKKLTDTFNWLTDNWKLIAGIGIALVIGKVVGVVGGIVGAILTLKTALAAMAPVLWPLLGAIAVGVAGWAGYKALKNKITGGGKFEEFDEKARKAAEEQGVRIPQGTKRDKWGAKLVDKFGDPIQAPMYGKNSITGREYNFLLDRPNKKDKMVDLDLYYEGHRKYILRNMGKEKLAGFDAARERFHSSIDDKVVLKDERDAKRDKVKHTVTEDRMGQRREIEKRKGKNSEEYRQFLKLQKEEIASKEKEVTEEYNEKLLNLQLKLGYKSGGEVGGSGGPKSDDQWVRASSGEYFIQNPYSQLFKPLLKDINDGGGSVWKDFNAATETSIKSFKEQIHVTKEFAKTSKDFELWTKKEIDKRKSQKSGIKPSPSTNLGGDGKDGDSSKKSSAAKIDGVSKEGRNLKKDKKSSINILPIELPTIYSSPKNVEGMVKEKQSDGNPPDISPIDTSNTWLLYTASIYEIITNEMVEI